MLVQQLQFWCFFRRRWVHSLHSIILNPDFFLICAARLVIPNPSMYSSRLSSLSAYQLLNWFSVIWFISMRRTHYFTSNAILLHWKYVIFTSGLFKQISPYGKCLIFIPIAYPNQKSNIQIAMQNLMVTTNQKPIINIHTKKEKGTQT